MESFFWISVIVIFYTYLGYALVLFLSVRAKRKRKHNKSRLEKVDRELPSCTVVIAAYNEEYVIEQKIINTLSLKYPENKLSILIIADGSDDHTADIIRNYSTIRLLYQPTRKGKVAAINRAMKRVGSEIVVFTDANTFLNEDALINIACHYADPQVGGVAGEKRIFMPERAEASSAGEGLYWKYESRLKQWDAELLTTIGAAGELFSIRRALYDDVAPSTILDDFIISMRIAEMGFKIAYEPNAYAIEDSSLNVKEELKRKIRIAAGGIQAIVKLRKLLIPFKHPLLSFQYISHRVLRWTIAPLVLIPLLIVNTILVFTTNAWVYQASLAFQFLFYGLAVAGLVLENRKVRMKFSFVPYYFCMMNFAVIVGILKYLRNEQSSLWEKAIRKESNESRKLYI